MTNLTTKTLSAIALTYCFIFPILSMAHSCSDYPYTDGINIENVKGGVKILSTSSATVTFDDVDSVRDARDEAILEAKAAISKFLNEGIKSDEIISKAVNETKTMSGDQKQSVRNETISRVKKLSTSSQSLLRGVVLLGECYTKAREVRVSVGIKPETIDAAGNLANDINNSNSSTTQNNSSRSSPSSSPTQLNSVDSYNNSDRLKRF